MLCYECDNENFKELYKNSAGDVYYSCLACGVWFAVDRAGGYINTFWQKPGRYVPEEFWVDGVCLCCSSRNVQQIGTTDQNWVEYRCDMCGWTFVVKT